MNLTVTCSESAIETVEKDEKSNLTIKTSKRRCSVFFSVNFEHISHLFLMFQLLTLSK